MLYCEVILLATLGLALGYLPSSFSIPPQDELLAFDAYNTPYVLPTEPSYQDADEANVEDDEVMGICIFGSYPTATCMVRCLWQNMSTYCDEDANCRCGSQTEEEDVEWSYRAPEEDFTAPQPDFDVEEGVMGVCYFGHIPSPTCLFRCSVRGRSAVCEEDSSCLCEDRTWRDLVTPTHSLDRVSQNPQETTKNDSGNDKNGSVTFFIFDLGSLFEPDDTPVKEDSDSSCITRDLWTFPHIIAVAVLLLVTVFLIVEVTLFCKRSYRKQHPQTVLASAALEKGVTIEKHV